MDSILIKGSMILPTVDVKSYAEKYSVFGRMLHLHDFVTALEAKKVKRDNKLYLQRGIG